MDIKKFLYSTLLVGILATAGCDKVADESELKFGEEVGVTAQANTTTTNISMTKPALGSSGWGTLLNANFDILDGKFNSTGTPTIFSTTELAWVGPGNADYETITAACAAGPLLIIVAPGNYSSEAAITIPAGTILVAYGATLPTITSGTYYNFSTTGAVTAAGTPSLNLSGPNPEIDATDGQVGTFDDSWQFNTAKAASRVVYVAKSFTDVAATGVGGGAYSTVATISIPAGAVTTTSIFKIYALLIANDATDAKYARVCFGAVGNILGTTTLLNGKNSIFIANIIVNDGATDAQIGIGDGAAWNSGETDILQVESVETAAGFDILILGAVETEGDNITCKAAWVEVIR